MDTSDVLRLQVLMRSKDWASVYSMLDDARSRAVTRDDMKQEVYWRATALENEQRYAEALNLLQTNTGLANSMSLWSHQIACLLVKLDRDKDAVDELSKAPIEEEMKDHYGLAIDAKFFYLYLLAKNGDPSVRDRLVEIPDDYRYITMEGQFLTKADIIALLR